jgi:hypothetical protein
MAWFALLAEFSQELQNVERRGAVRRKLAIESVLTASRPPSKIVVFDLSEAGLMLHCHEDLAIGETFEVMLPEAGVVEARVMWKRATLHGCAFLTPVSRGTISAVLLKAQGDRGYEPGN